MQHAGNDRLGHGLWATVRLLPKVSRPMTAAVGVLMLVAGILPVGFIVASGRLVGRVPAAVRDGLDGPGGRALLAALAVVAGIFVAEQIVGLLLDFLSDVLGRRLNGYLRDRVTEASLGPTGIGHLETPEIVDTIMLARNVQPGFYTPGSAVFGIVAGVSARLRAVGAAVIVATFNPFLAIGLFLSGAFSQTLLLRVFFRSIRAQMAGRPGTDLRRSVYFRDLALTAGAAKELRVFGLAAWVSRRYASAWLDAMSQSWERRRSSQGQLLVAALVAAAAGFAGSVLVIDAALDGRVGLARFAVLIGAVGSSILAMASDNDLRAAYGASAVPALLDLERRLEAPELAPARPLAPLPLAADQPTGALRFENVSFRYPGTDQDVYHGLDLTIPAGRSLAIVGVNGAGKTTLVKLLARLYEPTSGRITVDGTPLTDIDPDGWRAKLAVLFQDFIRYALPATDNVGFGAGGGRVANGAGGHDPATLRRAAERAGALDLVEGLPDGWDTVLSRTQSGGADLSGGQWQRVALARALMAVEHGARVLILDEPTANLDVRAEAEIYDRFLDLTHGLTSIVISHRFSTVRHADHIVVIDGGRVVEEGDHDSLVALGGRYARMFRVQAERFAEPATAGGEPDA